MALYELVLTLTSTLTLSYSIWAT